MKSIKFFILTIFLNYFFLSISNAEVINRIKIEGNKRITDEIILMFSGIDVGKDITSSAVNEIIKNLFETDLYRDVSDIFGKENSQRQFYTVPGNQSPNDQGAFAQWLYGTPPTCKEGNKTACSTNWVGPGGGSPSGPSSS